MNERTFPPERAHKLDDPARSRWLPPEDVVEKLELTPGMTVADIGAGTGYFSIPIARKIEPGRVHAVDLQGQMLETLREKLSTDAITNVVVTEGSASATNLDAELCDLVFLANVWHELNDHAAVLDEARRILRSEGRLVILDWRKSIDPPPGPPTEHRVSMTETVDMLKAKAWRVERVTLVGKYSYLILASR
ncbi:MAG TPA: methyltransferase domain-containing protein [Thermoanaerobaculia bacterium]|nr:methyltransferase domain-containing protein [Thermoanaerobaculia bacterium]